uniref:Uncharacterized protein n=1 Tax=viral metagenome TaxID=1070528 RepID=A0A6C0HTS1_9ZZZZ
MIVYTDDDIPIVYNPIQINDPKNIATKEPENDTKIDDKKINVNIVVRFIWWCCFNTED